MRSAHSEAIRQCRNVDSRCHRRSIICVTCDSYPVPRHGTGSPLSAPVLPAVRSPPKFSYTYPFQQTPHAYPKRIRCILWITTRPRSRRDVLCQLSVLCLPLALDPAELAYQLPHRVVHVSQQSDPVRERCPRALSARGHRRPRFSRRGCSQGRSRGGKIRDVLG
jgi:hypothetical protein